MVSGCRISLLSPCDGDGTALEHDGGSGTVPHQSGNLFGSVVMVLEKLGLELKLFERKVLVRMLNR
jgi:hypothetical protein